MNNTIEYYTKYIKYKEKYLKLKNNLPIQKGSGAYESTLISFMLSIYFNNKQFNFSSDGCNWGEYNQYGMLTRIHKKSDYVFTVTSNEKEEESSNTIFDFDHLNIENTLEHILHLYEKFNILELRPYNKEHTLVVACGNYRVDNSNFGKSYNVTSRPKFNLLHSHKNCYTIDASLTANPSTLSNFDSESKYGNLPDNAFTSIIFEGGGNPRDNPNEIKRLLNKKALSFCIYMDIEKGYRVYSCFDNDNYIIYAD